MIASQTSSKAQTPPAYVLNAVGNHTGIWMGWWWINGKPIAKAPPVER